MARLIPTLLACILIPSVAYCAEPAGMPDGQIQSIIRWIEAKGVPNLRTASFVEFRYSEPLAGERGPCLGFLVGEKDSTYTIYSLGLETLHIEERGGPNRLTLVGEISVLDFKDEVANALEALDVISKDDQFSPFAIPKVGRNYIFRAQVPPDYVTRITILASAAFDKKLSSQSQRLLEYAYKACRARHINDRDCLVQLLADDLSHMRDVRWLRHVHDATFPSWQILQSEANSIFESFSETQAGKDAKRRVEIIERMRQLDLNKPDSNPPKPLEPSEVRIQKLIHQLTEHCAFQTEKLVLGPNGTDVYSDPRGDNSPGVQLIAIGNAAVPALIDAVNDTRLTRSIGNGKGGAMQYNLMVGDLAIEIIREITAGRIKIDARIHDDAMPADALWWATPKDNEKFQQDLKKAWEDQKKSRPNKGVVLPENST